MRWMFDTPFGGGLHSRRMGAVERDIVALVADEIRATPLLTCPPPTSGPLPEAPARTQPLVPPLQIASTGKNSVSDPSVCRFRGLSVERDP